MKIHSLKHNRKGYALLYVTVISLAVLTAFAVFARFTSPYNLRKGNAQISSRVEAGADSAIEYLLMQINSFPNELQTDPLLNPGNPDKTGISSISAYYQKNPPSDKTVLKKTAVAYGIDYLLLQLNGGVDNLQTDFSDTDPYDYLQLNNEQYDKSSVEENSGSLWDAEDNIAIYLYDMQNNVLYALGNPDGTLKDYSEENIWDKEYPPVYYVANDALINVESGIVQSSSFKSFDPNFLTDNRWVEINTNVQYTDNGGNFPSTKFSIRTSARFVTNSSKQEIVRNLYAEATLQTVDVKVASQSGSNTNGQIPSAFKYSVYSGQGFISNGNIRFNEGDIQNNGTYTKDWNGGDVYVDGDSILNGNIIVGGYLATSQGRGSVMRNGFVKIKKGIQYNKKEKLPQFSPDEENNVRSNALLSSASSSRGFTHSIDLNGWNNVLNINGINYSHYVNGHVNINGDATVNIYPSILSDGTKTKTGWYINGNLNFNGDTVLNFTEPTIVWVNGDVTFNGNTQINGSGTIVANGQIIFNGWQGIKYNNDKDLDAFISLGKEMPSSGEKWGGIIVNGFGTYEGIFYAPNSDIIFNGEAKVFGSVVGGGQVRVGNGVILNGDGEFTFDKRLASGQNIVIPPIPSDSSNSITGWKVYKPLDKYRLTWKEIIGQEVTPANIKKLQPEFNYQASGK